MVDKELFAYAKAKAVAESTEYSGIGRLNEKLLHRTLKYYFEPDESFHEIEVLGSVADIRNEEGITEIQTRSFGKLLPKLEKFLPKLPVKVVFPIIERKIICPVDVESGESLPPRKSPKKGKICDSLKELCRLGNLVTNENLTVCLVLIDAEETRMLNRKKRVGRKRTDKIDCIPTSINCIIELKKPSDYAALIPKTLSESFTAKEFEKKTGLVSIDAHSSLKFLLQLGCLKREREGGRAYIYSRICEQ